MVALLDRTRLFAAPNHPGVGLRDSELGGDLASRASRRPDLVPQLRVDLDVAGWMLGASRHLQMLFANAELLLAAVVDYSTGRHGAVGSFVGDEVRVAVGVNAVPKHLAYRARPDIAGGLVAAVFNDKVAKRIAALVVAVNVAERFAFHVPGLATTGRGKRRSLPAATEAESRRVRAFAGYRIPHRATLTEGSPAWAV